MFILFIGSDVHLFRDPNLNMEIDGNIIYVRVGAALTMYGDRYRYICLF